MMKTLSPIGEAIRHYKLNASGGYEEWSKVARQRQTTGCMYRPWVLM